MFLNGPLFNKKYKLFFRRFMFNFFNTFSSTTPAFTCIFGLDSPAICAFENKLFFNFFLIKINFFWHNIISKLLKIIQKILYIKTYHKSLKIGNFLSFKHLVEMGRIELPCRRLL